MIGLHGWMRGNPDILTAAKHLLVYLKQALVTGDRHGYMRWASPQPGLGIHQNQAVADIGVQSWSAEPTEIFPSYNVADVFMAAP